MNTHFPIAFFTALALGACGAETTTTNDNEGYYGGDVAGQADGNAVSGIELPDLSPELAKAASERGTLRCMLPLIPDWTSGEMISGEDKGDVRFLTASPPREVAAFYTAATLAKKGDVAVSGAGNEVEIRIHAQDLNKCKITAKPGPDGKTEVTLLLTGFGQRK